MKRERINRCVVGRGVDAPVVDDEGTAGEHRGDEFGCQVRRSPVQEICGVGKPCSFS